ncbi:MAG TPA: hypothetical protein VI566_05360 [Xanthomonadales bacterium]|nr:hypothetical protein [Xanthomonadales bacterium]
MRKKGLSTDFNYLFLGFLVAAWAAAYFALPRLSSYDGPFNAEPFAFQADGLPFLSKTELKAFGIKVFVLETRENLGPAPGSVFVLKGRSGKILWTRVGAPELGHILLEDKSARWFLPGGWVIRMKPEFTGSGELYVSPLGQFRFFFHRW